MDFKKGKRVEAQARLVILNVYSFFCGERDDLGRLSILNDYSSVQYNVRRDELASFPSNSLSKARAVFKKMFTVRAKLKKSDDSHEIYFYARVALKILFLNEPPGELRNRIFNATSA